MPPRPQERSCDTGEVLRLNRVCATLFRRNPASGPFLDNIGMTYEGCLRQHVQKWGRHEDLEHYGMVKPEYEMLRRW